MMKLDIFLKDIKDPWLKLKHGNTLQCVVVFRYEKPVTPLCLCPKKKKKKKENRTEMTQPCMTSTCGTESPCGCPPKPYYTEEVQALGVMNETFVSWGEAWVAMCGICLV